MYFQELSWAPRAEVCGTLRPSVGGSSCCWCGRGLLRAVQTTASRLPLVVQRLENSVLCIPNCCKNSLKFSRNCRGSWKPAFPTLELLVESHLNRVVIWFAPQHWLVLLPPVEQPSCPCGEPTVSLSLSAVTLCLGTRRSWLSFGREQTQTAFV